MNSLLEKMDDIKHSLASLDKANEWLHSAFDEGLILLAQFDSATATNDRCATALHDRLNNLRNINS